jgi:hypothetical protein
MARRSTLNLVHRSLPGKFVLLIVDWKNDVRDAAVIEGVAAGFVG